MLQQKYQSLQKWHCHSFIACVGVAIPSNKLHTRPYFQKNHVTTFMMSSIGPIYQEVFQYKFLTDKFVNGMY